MTIPAEHDYYKKMLKDLIKVNNNEGNLFCNERLQQAVIDLGSEINLEHERNINNTTRDDLYQSPMKKKDVSTINNSVYYESDEHIDTISDSNKRVDPRSNPMAKTHIGNRIRKLSVGVGLFEPAIIGVIRKDLVTNFQ